MLKKLLVIVCLLLIASSALAQAPYDFRRNDDGVTITGQPNNVPVWGAVTRYGDVLTTNKPGLFACSAAAVGVTDVAIIAAVAAKSHYVHSINCYNDSAVVSIISFKDDTTVFWSDYIGSTVLGNNRITITFPRPKKGTLNKPINLDMTTTATSTVCCANYEDIPNP